MYRKRFWNGHTIISYWHKGTKYAIAMTGKFESLDEMAAAVSAGQNYILRIVRVN